MKVYSHNLAKEFLRLPNWSMCVWVFGRITIVWDSNKPGPQTVSTQEIFGDKS